MAYCPVVAGENIGNKQVWGCEPHADANATFEDLLCCAGNWSNTGLETDGSGTPYGGLFNCTEGSYGYMEPNMFSPNGTQICIDRNESLTCIAGREVPVCWEVDACGGVCPPSSAYC